MPGQFEIMPGADQGCEMASLARRIDRRFAIRPKPPTSRESLCRGKCFGPVGFQRIGNLAGDTGSAKRLDKAPVTISAPRKRTCPRFGKFGIVDVTGGHELRCQGVDRRGLFPVPSPRQNLAFQIGSEAFLGRREAADIVQRERFEGRRIQRPYRAGRSGVRQSAVFVPQSNRIENDTFQYPQTKVATGAIICRTSPT